MNKNNNTILITMLFFIIPIWIVSMWTDRNLDFIFSYFKNEIVDIPMWISAIITIILNVVIIILNIIVELLRFVI